MADAVLVAEGLRKTYFRAGRTAARDFAAVDDVSLSLEPGVFVALQGRSGGGKTTLLNMLAGLLVPSAGTVRLDGQDLYALADAELSRLRNAQLGVVPQGASPLFALTVCENVCLPLTMYGAVPAAQAEGCALALLERMGIAELADALPQELSGGELRRMAIARALVGGPRVLFADEPTGDLDDENTEVVLRVLRETADAGTAVFIVTHEEQAAAHADRTLRLDAGRLVPVVAPHAHEEG